MLNMYQPTVQGQIHEMENQTKGYVQGGLQDKEYMEKVRGCEGEINVLTCVQ